MFIFVEVNGFMAHILVVLGALLLSVSVLQWGKLFLLDELPEFNRSVLEVMRQPLEDRIISISRAKYSTEYPASFMLVASMNPCPCGYYGHPKKKCVCNEYQRTHYMSKISGPLLDRIDLQIEVQPVDFEGISIIDSSEISEGERYKKRGADVIGRFLGLKDIGLVGGI